MLGTLTITVGQRESTSVSQKEQASESLENMPQEESAAVEISPKDAQETIDEMPVSEEKHEKVEQSNEAQSNEVGFKKVFKFVGFRFTVKKDKTEKTEPVQLLTVKKDEVEANGTENLEVKTPTADEKSEAVDHCKSDTLEADKLNEEVVNGVNQVEEDTVEGKSLLEAPTEKVEEENAEHNENQDAVEGEKDPKTSPVSPTNPLVTETTSPFKKFFTQGWAGLRKKTSFKKTKEDEQEKNKSETHGEASDSTLKAAEDHTVETSEATIKQEAVIALEENPETSIVDVKEPTEEPSVPLADISTDLKLEETDESDVLIADAEIVLDKHVQHEEERPLLEVESVTFVEETTEHEVVIAASEIISKEGAGEIDDASENVKAEATVLSSLEKSNEEQELQDVKLIDELPNVKEPSQILEVSQEQEIQQSPPDVSEQKPSEGVSNGVELLSSQEKTKLQGSPLRKLFTGSSLKKLSGKKHKAKKEDEPKPEEATEQLQSSSEVPEAPEIDKGDSIPSSPEEPVDALSSEKPQTEATQVSEGEGEGATSDGERKKDGITPWASFKKLVTPKKRAKKLSESDKEDEPEKAGKSATMSSTDSSNSDNQEEAKVTEEEPKLEKSTEEPKRKVDSSVSWEALICVGSSKKRARKCSDSDEEETQKPLEEKPHEDDQKPDAEAEKIAETETEVAITTSQESDQGQGGSSPEQAGSPSEGEGVSTWASFKRLVTPRRRSRTRMEEKVDEPTTTVNAEHSTSEAEPGKDESWVSFKKLIPGRKKKKSDGKPEHALVEGQEIVEDEDGDVPAVVPLSEYEAAEQEKIEAQQALQTEITKTTAPLSAPEEDLDQAEESCDGLVHAVTVTVVEGERAITSMEDRSPSWISATVTETIEQEDFCKNVQQTKQAVEMDVVIESLVVVKTLDFVSSEVSGPTTAEMELTSEAVTALDEVMEASYAEETTEMVSAVSQLGESQATTEESTPVPEADNSQQILKELQRQTQEVLKEVAEKVRHVEKITSTREIEVRGFPSQRRELDIIDDIPNDIVTMQASAFDEASLTKEELREREMDQEEHVDDMQKVKATVCRKVSGIVVENSLGAQEHIEVNQSHVVEDKHVKHGKDSTEEHGEEIGGEIGEVVRSALEMKDQVITSTTKMSSEPGVISEEIIVVQKQYQMSSAPQNKLSSEIEANHLIDKHVSVELLIGEEQNVDILEEHIKVDQSNVVEDEDERRGKDSTEEHGGEIEKVIRSTFEMKDQLITSTIKTSSETGLISEEITVVQKQYQISSAPKDKLSSEIGVRDLIDEHLSVELLTGEEQNVDILEEHITVDQSHEVEDEDERHGKDSTEEHGGEIGEVVRSALEMKDQVITSTIKMSSEPGVISDEIIVVQKQYQMSSAPADKLSSKIEANHLVDEHVSVELLTGEEQNVDILEEHIKVDQSNVVEDEDERRGKDSTEEYGGEIEKVVRSTLEMKDQLITSTVKTSSETGLISEEITVVQKQYQIYSAPADKLSSETGVRDLIDEHFPAAHLESVELLTGEEENVDILEKEENILEVDLVQNSIDSTFNIATKEFTVIEQVVQAVQADIGEIIMPEIQPEPKEQPYVACNQESVQTEITLLVPEVIQQVTEIAGEESPCTELRVEQNEEPICLKEVIETKAEGIQTLLAQLVMLPQVDACENVKMEENEFVAEKSKIETNQCMLLSQVEEILPVQEEIIVKHIPEVDTSEAQVESVLITAAAVEEKLVAETVTLLEASNVTLEPVDATVTEDFASISSDAPAVESQCEKGMMESVSQSAAAIIDAAFEAISSSTLDSNLENVPLSHGEEMEGDATNEKVSQEIIQSQVEVLGAQIISQVSIDPQSSTFMQDPTHTVINELGGFDEELKSNYAPEILPEMDTSLIAGTIIEVQETKTDLHMEEKLSEQAVIKKPRLICQINTTENLVSEANLQEAIIGQPDGKIKISDGTQDVFVDQVAAALEESTTHASSLSGSESIEILPSIQEPSDVQVDLERGHTVDIEHQTVEIVQSIQSVASQEVETAEDTIAIEAAVEQCLDETVKVSDDAYEVKETVEQLEPELDVLQTGYEQAEVSCTVSIETHSSTIVEKIIQTAVEEVEKVEEEVTASTVPEVGHKKDTDQSIKEPPEIAVAREPVEEQKLVSVAIEEGSDVSHVVITESYCSTVVETIVMTTFEEEQLVSNSVTEVQSPVETDQSSEDAIMSEFQDVLEQTIKEPSIQQTEKWHSESSCTVSIESQSTTIIQTVEVGDTAREEAHKATEEPGELESDRILDGTSDTGDHALTVLATEDSFACLEGQEEADIRSSVEITVQVEEPLGLTQDILLSDTCSGEESTVSFQVAVEPTEAVQPAYEVFEQVSQQTAAKDCNDLPDQVSDVAVSDIHYKIETIEIHEGTCAFEADKTLETDQVAANVESEVHNGMEHSQKSTEEAVCDSQDWEQAGEPSSAETTVEVKVGPSLVTDLTESQVSIRQTQDIVLSDTFKGDKGTVAFQVAVETTGVVQQEHEFIEHLAVQVCQENAAEANNDPPVMEPKLLKEEIALQGVEDGQQSDPHPESQTKYVDRERPTSDTEIIELPATLSQECLEAAEQLEVTKTEKTEVHEQAIVVDSVLPNQVGEEEQIQASEDTKSAEHALHEHPHSKSEFAES